MSEFIVVVTTIDRIVHG